MKQFNVTGMSCAACSARVEKAVGKIDGVTSCSVSLLTNSMTVEGDVPSDDIIKAVVKAGYGAYEKSAENKKDGDTNGDETSALKHRLFTFLCIFLWDILCCPCHCLRFLLMRLFI